MQKTSAVKSEIHFRKEAFKNYGGKILKGNSIIGRRWSYVKLFLMQNYADSTNRMRL